MDIRIETTYHNCFLLFENIQAKEVGNYGCELTFNSGWLSCKRHFVFSKSNASKFKRKIEKINKPFDTIAILETTDKSSRIEFECIASGTIMISGKFIEQSEFEQQAIMGFNIEKEALDFFSNEFRALLKIS